MDWIPRLNEEHLHVELADGLSVEVMQWAHSPVLNYGDDLLHRHTYFEACLLGDGWNATGCYVIQGHHYTIGSGDLFIARPGVLHQILNPTPPLELFWVAYSLNLKSSEALPPFWHDFTRSPIFVAHKAQTASLLWRTLRDVAECATYQVIAQVAAALFHAIATHLTPSDAPGSSHSQHPSTKTKDSTMLLAVRYVQDNLDRPLRTEDVARQVHLSARHFSRRFRSFADQPFYTYVIAARLNKARHLLENTDLPVKEVASQVGYPNVHHFTRVFSRQIGQPPARYRALMNAPGGINPQMSSED